MTTMRLTVLLLSLIAASMVAPSPGQVLADGILPDGCLGNLGGNQVIVYYFHRKFRCQSCETVEAALQPVLKNTFSDYLGDGRLAMCIINVDDPENRHYLDQFKILTNSIVIVEKKSGAISRYKNLENIWDVSGNRDAISQMLQTELGGFLSES